jgi:hypothetical protein
VVHKAALGQVSPDNHATDCSTLIIIHHPGLVQQAKQWPTYHLKPVSPHPKEARHLVTTPPQGSKTSSHWMAIRAQVSHCVAILSPVCLVTGHVPPSAGLGPLPDGILLSARGMMATALSGGDPTQQCRLVTTDVSEQRVASFLRIENPRAKSISRWLTDCSRLLQTVGHLLTRFFALDFYTLKMEAISSSETSVVRRPA